MHEEQDFPTFATTLQGRGNLKCHEEKLIPQYFFIAVKLCINSQKTIKDKVSRWQIGSQQQVWTSMQMLWGPQSPYLNYKLFTHRKLPNPIGLCKWTGARMYTFCLWPKWENNVEKEQKSKKEKGKRTQVPSLLFLSWIIRTCRNYKATMTLG